MLLSYASVLELLCVIYYDSWFCHNLNTSMEKGLVSSCMYWWTFSFYLLICWTLSFALCQIGKQEMPSSVACCTCCLNSLFLFQCCYKLFWVFFCNGISILVLMETTYHAIFMQWYLFNLILCMLFFPSLGWRQWIGAMWWWPWETCCKID